MVTDVRRILGDFSVSGLRKKAHPENQTSEIFGGAFLDASRGNFRSFGKYNDPEA
jgi:hypothetical protein